MHYSRTFPKYKEIDECNTLNHKFRGNNLHSPSFSAAELRAALNACESAAPGADRITYDMIENMHTDQQITFLALLNIWPAGHLPPTWKEAIVVLVLKQGKDPSFVTSYRPIALASFLCKLFGKKMIIAVFCIS